ncbi:hypothetical protein DPMN_179344 [Dreissena polymorpha]|uniref:Uncharacterized protein n=1 Tax=Dreissena polymorpha TaxID=45954 RepID=A0A9D4EFW8_DREPO|nr:hypothetical protein DPMN_179344 [Dreissena polymorpha]
MGERVTTKFNRRLVTARTIYTETYAIFLMSVMLIRVRMAVFERKGKVCPVFEEEDLPEDGLRYATPVGGRTLPSPIVVHSNREKNKRHQGNNGWCSTTDAAGAGKGGNTLPSTKASSSMVTVDTKDATMAILIGLSQVTTDAVGTG